MLFTLHYGIIHYPSIIYIITSAMLLHFSITSGIADLLASHKKIEKEIKEALELLSFESEDFSKLIQSGNKFVLDIKSIVLHGGIEDDMEFVVQKRVLNLSNKYEKLIAEYGYIATILPMLGMLGTITGLLQMFAISDGVDNIAQKMASLSVALATTLYATLWVILITKPKSRELELKLIKLEAQEQQLILNAKLFLHNADINEFIERTIEENDEEEK
jgi:biopolymer transport protein ExbB/TolQ